MSSIEWKREMASMLMNVENQVTFALNNINRSGRSLNEEFKAYFFKTLNDRVVTTYAKFEMELRLETTNKTQVKNESTSNLIEIDDSSDDESPDQSTGSMQSNGNLDHTLNDRATSTSVVRSADEHVEEAEVKQECLRQLDNIITQTFTGAIDSIGLSSGDHVATGSDLAPNEQTTRPVSSQTNTGERGAGMDETIKLMDSNDHSAIVHENVFASGRIGELSTSASEHAIQIDSSDNEEIADEPSGDGDTTTIGNATTSNDTEQNQSGNSFTARNTTDARISTPAGNLEKKRKTPHKQSTSSKVAKTVYANRKLGRPPCQSQHKKQFSCTICEYSSSRRLDFENHMRTHTGEKPYRCDRCGKRCTTAQWLKKHVVIHTDVFPFYCGGCFSRFSLKSEKEAHLKVCKVRRYECYLCDKFKSGGKDHMIQHMRSHTGEKPFRCEVCMKCFTLKCTLNRHLDTVHTRVNA